MRERKNNERKNNERKNKDITEKGSITVEAAFVMPIVIITIFALIYLAFYLHDICKIQGITDLTVHKAAIAMKHETDIASGEVNYESISDRGVFYIMLGSTEDEEKQIEHYLKQRLLDNLFLIQVKRVSVDINQFKLSAQVETKTTVTLPGIKNLFQGITDKIITEEYPIQNPAETIRFMEVVLDTGSSIKGVEEIKKKLTDMVRTE